MTQPQYPDCPFCGGDVIVPGGKGWDYRCQTCQEYFDGGISNHCESLVDEYRHEMADDPSAYLSELAERLAVALDYLNDIGWNTSLSFGPAVSTITKHIEALNLLGDAPEE